jgi:archaemetzincin
MKLCLLLIPVLFLSCHSKQSGFTLFSTQSHKKIYVQPFESFSSSRTAYLVSELRKICPDVALLKPATFPARAWYEPRKRYRADSLIYWLKNRANDNEVIIGLTSKDISTTKNEVRDYGVIGLGFTPGKSCIVSTFRLNKQNLKQQLFKVSIHELGHSQGLNHCRVKTCFMRDAEGSNPTDDEKGFCESCRKVLINKGWNYK